MSHPPPPAVGDEVYVPTSRYLGRGVDDFAGGRCRVAAVDTGGPVPLVEVAERPGVQYGWPLLAARQAELAARYGESRGRPEPDGRPRFNEGSWAPPP